MCKIPKIPSRNFIVCLCSLVNVFKTSDSYVFAVNPQINYPSVYGSIPTNAFISRCVVAASASIGLVLRSRTRTQIATAIIERIAVAMVHISTRKIEDESVHLSQFPVFGIDPRLSFMGIPSPLHKPIIVRSINNSVLFLSKGDEADRLIERLDYGVTSHTAFHSLSEKEMCENPTALVYQGAS